MTEDQPINDLAKKYLDLWQEQWGGFLKNKTPSDFKLWEEMLKGNYQSEDISNVESQEATNSTGKKQKSASNATYELAQHLDVIQNRLDAIEKRLTDIQSLLKPKSSRTNLQNKKCRAKRTK